MDIVLIGAGNMGSAMIKGLSQYNLKVIDKNENRLKELKKQFPHIKVDTKIDNIDNKIVILAIKPQSLSSIKLKGVAKALISILAGVTLKRLKEQINAKYYIRAMPNVAAMKQKSITSITGNIEFKEISIKILDSIGKSVWLNSEDELDIATALAASSPAWLAIVSEALLDGAVNLGLNRAKAYEYIGYLFEGVGEILKDTHPAIFKDMVTSPAGTTIAGLASLEDDKIRSAFIKAMKESYLKAKKL